MNLEKVFRIAVLPGDGIGPEVIAEAVRTLRTVEQDLEGVCFELRELSVGAGTFLECGNPLPPETLEACRQQDAILLGAMGLPSVRWPSGLEMAPQVDLREQLDLYCGLRPYYLYQADLSPLKGMEDGRIDFLIVRESTEGLFSGRLKPIDPAAAEARDQMVISRSGSERLFRSAFRQAMGRRRRLTLVDKANILPSMAYFRGIFQEISREFPEVETEALYVDAASLHLIERPADFDVLVTENMFGDILSDLAAGLVGGMGMAPSADIGDDFAVFQPAHGSAPDIAGRGVANPLATLLSTAMMLDWLGHPETRRAAGAVRKAVTEVLVAPRNRTADLGGRLKTAEMGSLVTEAAARLLSRQAGNKPLD